MHNVVHSLQALVGPSDIPAVNFSTCRYINKHNDRQYIHRFFTFSLFLILSNRNIHNGTTELSQSIQGPRPSGRRHRRQQRVRAYDMQGENTKF